MPEQLWFTAFLNHILAGPVTALLRALHIQPEFPSAPIPNSVAMEVLVLGILIIFFLAVRARLSVTDPGALQHIVEAARNFIQDQSNEIIGHHSEGFTAFLMTLGLFILMCNLLGLVPGFESPTATPYVPLGCAIVAFFYYHIQGIKRQGPLKYARHFAGPMLLLAPLMIPIEIISHLARVLSLTIRLYANMFAGEQVTMAFLGLTYLVIPVAFQGLHVFVSFLQAFIFMVLAMLYVGAAVAHEEEGH